MQSSLARAVCRVLIALTIWTPYQIAQAGMIGTDQVVQQSSHSDRSTVLNLLSRSDVASQLQTFGIDPSTAKDRVASMSDEEVRYLSGKIESLPAGANKTAVVLVVVHVLIAAGVWWYYKRQRASTPNGTPASPRALSFAAPPSFSPGAPPYFRRQ